jgi:hypothetical protein
MSRLLNTISKPLCVATVAAAASPFVASGSIYGVPAPIVFGAVAYGASMISETSKNYVIPMITDDYTGRVAVNVVAPAVTGAATALIMFALDGTSLDIGTAVRGFGLGFVAELGGNYVNDEVLIPLINPAI